MDGWGNDVRAVKTTREYKVKVMLTESKKKAREKRMCTTFHTLPDIVLCGFYSFLPLQRHCHRSQYHAGHRYLDYKRRVEGRAGGGAERPESTIEKHPILRLSKFTQHSVYRVEGCVYLFSDLIVTRRGRVSADGFKPVPLYS